MMQKMKHINDIDKAFFKVLAVILSSFTKDQLTVAEKMLFVFENRFLTSKIEDKSLSRILIWVLNAKKDNLITK
jgi:hypothetical protein